LSSGGLRVEVVGLGAVGTRAARQLVTTEGVDEVIVSDVDRRRASAVAESLGPKAREVVPPGGANGGLSLDGDRSGVDVVLLAHPVPHAALATAYLRAGIHVVSAGDDRRDVATMLGSSALAEASGRALVVGAAFAPGMSCLLARRGAASLDEVDEIHVATTGTGGPACARQHHWAMARGGVSWRGGMWREHASGSGRALCWFPEPVGVLDCYTADLADPIVLHAAFPRATRVRARMAATRRDRLTARLPMLRPPHPEGLLGAIRVELSGCVGTARRTVVLGAIDRPGAAAGSVLAVAALAIADGTIDRTGAFGLADADVPATALLSELARRGVKAAEFVGSSPG
jgi:saccharopine dehydrogenase-like NADP-dependent oxidoreductase